MLATARRSYGVTPIGAMSGYGERVIGKILGGVGRVLIAVGLLILGFVAFQLWGTGVETSRGQSTLTGDLATEVDAAAVSAGRVEEVKPEVKDIVTYLGTVDPATAPPMAPPPQGEPVGIISIPRIDLEKVIVEGVSKADLKKGPGHYPGTPLPGNPGNSGIAGHRTTYGAPFNRIDELSPGDEVTISTPQGQFVYEVIPAPGQTTQAWYTVKPNQVEVLDDMGDNRITLTACHPKYSAKERIIVHAVLKSPVATAAPVSTAPVERPTVEEFDDGLAGDPDALPTALMFLAGAVALAAAAWFAGQHFRKWAVYAVATPGVLVLVWFAYVYMDRYLPAL